MTDYLAAAGGPTEADKLVEGAFDLHHHGYPEISFDLRTRNEDVDEFTIARTAGMAGIVLKSHMFPTVGRAYHLKRAVPGIEVIPSITLNHAVGGFQPVSLESAALQGAKVVFFPTWGAAHDRARGGMSHYLRGHLKCASGFSVDSGLRVTDESGRVRPEVCECLAVAAEHKMLVCTGHISPEESIALAQRAKDFGIDTVVFSHPDSHSVGASREQIRDMVQLNAVCEFCVLGMLPAFQRISPKTAAEIIAEIKAENAVITTDYFFEWAPPASETLRMLAGTFLSLGVASDDVRKMLRDNPMRLLGLKSLPCPAHPYGH